ncbi:hypothetical protein GSU3538 [Geobacter sulfurreducens PCA]|uniref:Uncharacterized protein n=1 Tax=Geobacter sulfurreducens (strain ATCC 51573 / DSM 12127 / PCA) TaxID=243231 RepID=I7F9I7_GEOSL|nr:hypothetical protein GSU3538 [Geobacter sulfurreducens PCA]
MKHKRKGHDFSWPFAPVRPRSDIKLVEVAGIEGIEPKSETEPPNLLKTQGCRSGVFVLV